MACILGIVLIPAGISLDYISYPDQLSTLAMIRLISAGLIAIIYALHFWDKSAAHVRYLTMAGLLANALLGLIVKIDGLLTLEMLYNFGIDRHTLNGRRTDGN